MAYLKVAQCSHQAYLVLEAHSRPHSSLGALSQWLPLIGTGVSQTSAQVMSSVT